MKKFGNISTIFPKGTIVKFDGIPCKLLRDTPFYSETFIVVKDVTKKDMNKSIKEVVNNIDLRDEESIVAKLPTAQPVDVSDGYGEDKFTIKEQRMKEYDTPIVGKNLNICHYVKTNSGKFFPLEERGRTKEWMNEVSDIIIDFDKMDVIKNREGLSYRYDTVLEKLNERLIPDPRTLRFV